MNSYEYSSFRVWVISWIDVATGIPKKYIGVDMGRVATFPPIFCLVPMSLISLRQCIRDNRQTSGTFSTEMGRRLEKENRQN